MDSGDDEDLRPDALSAGGVLEFLKKPSPRSRALSTASQTLVDAQQRQQRFQLGATALSRSLTTTSELLTQVIGANREAVIAIPPNLNVLGLDLRLGASSVASDAPLPPSMVESRISQVINHSKKLQSRVNDTVSRVLVTGDLNAGKSSLCNALLRRKLLPVDQQPCTDVFCEVIDAQKNGGIEEVHAVHMSCTYDRANSESYVKFSISQLEDLVHESTQYKLLVVYITDPRSPEASLLANGVVDICLIDAPGLNVSAVTTTELFGRQEEIDLVIFVVSAENHFTQSAREFVGDAAREKSQMFIAVNRFDRIRDGDRCKARVLDQVKQLAPETHKRAKDFVHFVAADPETPPGSSPPPNTDPHDIEQLESAVRNFILHKRSDAKLAPARTFLLNVLTDLEAIAAANVVESQHECDALSAQLADLVPAIDADLQEYSTVSEKIERDTEKLVNQVCGDCEQFISQAVAQIGLSTAVEWPGIMQVFDYVAKTRDALVSQVLAAVTHCEDQARDVTASAVDSIKQLGVLHTAPSKVFNKKAMFSRRKDNLRRQIHAGFGFADLFDLPFLLERPLPVLTSSKSALVRAASAHATLGSALGGATLISAYQYILQAPSTGVRLLQQTASVLGSKAVALPALALAVVAVGAYVLYELPRTIPKRLARKIAFEIDEMGYVRLNAERIAGECRKVLHYPAMDVRAAFQTQLESRARQRDEFERGLAQSEQVLRVFQSLGSQAQEENKRVREISL